MPYEHYILVEVNKAKKTFNAAASHVYTDIRQRNNLLY